MANKTNVKKNGKEYFRITKTVGKRLNKKGQWVDHKKEFYGKNKKEAIQKYQVYMKKCEKKLDDSKCFGEIADYFVYEVFYYSNAADGTKEKYLRVYEQLLKSSGIAGKAIKDITSKDFQEMYNSSTLPHSTLRATNNILRRIYKYIEFEGFGTDITTNLIIPKSKKVLDNKDDREIVVWTDDEIQKMLHQLDHIDDFRLRLTIMIALNLGCRIGEILGLKYDLIDFKKKEVKIRNQLILKIDEENHNIRRPAISNKLKTSNSYRTLPLNDFLIDEIKRHQKWHKEEMKKKGYQTELVFTTSSGSMYDFSNVQTAFKRFCKRADVEYKRFTIFRHTFASKIAQLVSIQVASKLLGHESIEVTAKYYVHVSDEEKRAAIETINYRVVGIGEKKSGKSREK